MTWMLPERLNGPSPPGIDPEIWSTAVIHPDVEPAIVPVGLKIASPKDRRRYDMDAQRKKKQVLRRMILGALMQSPLYFSVPLVERRQLFKRIYETYNVR